MPFLSLKMTQYMVWKTCLIFKNVCPMRWSITVKEDWVTIIPSVNLLIPERLNSPLGMNQDKHILILWIKVDTEFRITKVGKQLKMRKLRVTVTASGNTHIFYSYFSTLTMDQQRFLAFVGSWNLEFNCFLVAESQKTDLTMGLLFFILIIKHSGKIYLGLTLHSFHRLTSYWHQWVIHLFSMLSLGPQTLVHAVQLREPRLKYDRATCSK